jgi:hypothetical protein
MHVELNWYQRISLWMRVGSIQAPNMKVASTLYRVLEKIRPSDQEQGEANLITKESGYEWRLPEPNYGTKEIRLETDEAEQLADALETAPLAVPVMDMSWMLPLIDQLKAKPAKEEVLQSQAA